MKTACVVNKRPGEANDFNEFIHKYLPKILENLKVRKMYFWEPFFE